LKDVLRRSVFVIDPDGRLVYRWDVPDPPRLPTVDETLAAFRDRSAVGS
jgi:peroxiredoxin